MKTAKLFKSLLSLALSILLLASVCVSGFSAYAEEATESTDVTVNFFDGTTAARYLGGGSQLTGEGNITGILEGKSVARITPQFASDERRQISIGSRGLEDGEIDLTAAKTISLFIKNDLGGSIKWRMNDYADTNENLGTTYHSNYFSTGTVYWMVDTVDNTAKRYSYSSAKYIYIPEDFEGYIIFDLTTCDADELSTFLACNLNHIFFWMQGFSEEMLGNPFYYGDMNISTVSAESMESDLTTDAVVEYVSLNPTTANTKSGLGMLAGEDYAIRYNQATISVIDNEYIGQSLAFINKGTPAIETAIIKAEQASKSYEAIIFKLKLDEGASMPQVLLNSSANTYQYGYFKTEWTTINLITNNVETFSTCQSNAIKLSDNKFEGYLIAHITDNTQVRVSQADTSTGSAEDYTWADLMTLYNGKYIDLRLSLSNYTTAEGCTLNLGEIYAVNDLNAHLKYILPNDRRLNIPSATNVNTYLINGASDKGNLQYVDGGNILGTSYKFTVSEANDMNAYEFKHYLFNVDTSYLDYEALVYRFKISNNAYDSLSIKIGGMWWYVNAEYTTYNTLNDTVRTYDAASSIKIEDDEFEGYVILNLSTATINGKSWNEFIKEKDGSSTMAYFFNQTASTTNTVAGKLNNLLWGESSVIKDLDAFMAELLPEDAVETDLNETVVVDPATANAPYFSVTGSSDTSPATVEVIDGGNVLGSAYKFTVSKDLAGDTSSNKVGSEFHTKLFTADDSYKDYAAIVYRVKTPGSASMTITMGSSYGYVNSKYTTINTLTGTINTGTTTNSKATISDDEFMGYIIVPLDESITTFTVSSKAVSWSSFLTSYDGKAVNAYIKLSHSPLKFNDWLWGETSLIYDIDEFVEKVTAPTVEGDANIDGLFDVRDLVRTKKAVAGIEDTTINAFNVKLTDVGTAIQSSDLAVLRKMLTVEDYRPVSDEIGMAIWGLNDLSAWDATYGDTYGSAKDLFNYAGASNIEGMRNNIANGATGWFKITDIFADNTATEISESSLTTLNNRINGMKVAGVWDDVVGFYTEEIRQSMTDEQYKILTKYLTDNYPGKRIMAVLSIEEVIGSEAYGSENSIAAACYDTYQYTTDICYDIYTTVDKERYQAYNKLLETNLDGLDYKQWYMPKTFYWDKADYDTEEYMLNHINLLYELLKEDIAAGKNAGGLWCFGWNSYVSTDENGEETGLIGLSEITAKGDYSNLLARIAEIAKEIKELNKVY